LCEKKKKKDNRTTPQILVF